MTISVLCKNQGFKGAKIPAAFLRGLSTANISGRAQIVYDFYTSSFNSTTQSDNSSGDLVFYLDGAHSPESMEACANWFCSVVKGNHKSLQCFRDKNMDRDSGNDDPVKVQQEAESTKVSKQVFSKINIILWHLRFSFQHYWWISPIPVLTSIYLGSLLNLDDVKDSQFYFSWFVDSPIQLHGSERPTYLTSKTSEYMCFLRYYACILVFLFYYVYIYCKKRVKERKKRKPSNLAKEVTNISNWLGFWPFCIVYSALGCLLYALFII